MLVPGVDGNGDRNVWIVFVGDSPAAVYNPIWLCLDRGLYTPNVFYLLYNKETERFLQPIEKMILKICSEYGIEKPEIRKILTSEDDIREMFEKTFKIVMEEKMKGSRIAVDLTPGRKYMAIVLALVALKCDIDHAFYLRLKDYRRFKDLEYPKIPEWMQIIDDLLKDLVWVSAHARKSAY